MNFASYTAQGTAGNAVSGGAWAVAVSMLPTGIQFQNSGLSGAAPTTLSYYEVLSGGISMQFTGPCASSPTVTVQAERSGSTVQLRIPYFQCTVGSGTIFTSASSLATRFQPTVDVCWNVAVFNINAVTTGSLLVNTAGVIAVYSGLGCVGNFGTGLGGLNSAASGTSMSTSVSYLVV